MKKLFNTFKTIGIFLLICLVIFMISGAVLGAMFFWFVLRIMIVAGIITLILIIYFKARRK